MNINSIVKNNLCIQCGICAASCPLRCIKMQRQNNDFLPVVDSHACVNCGLCNRVCSVAELSNYDATQNIEDFILADYIEIYRAKTKNPQVLENATSGGVATTLIATLLADKKYDCAFVISGYSYETQLETHPVCADEDLSCSQKSRYLTVSHCSAVRYIRENPDKRVILIGTGCIVSSFLNVIKSFNLNRDNYLLMGLFCDKTMNYGVYKYFAQHKIGGGRKLKNLYFRTKQAGGWPGGVKLEYTDGTSEILDRTERMKLKEYFMPEKCLYCLNKLNRGADIALGDNYISDNEDITGGSSVIVRSELGRNIWEQYSDNFAYSVDNADKLKQSQWLQSKKQNLAFAGIKGLIKTSITKRDRRAYRVAMHKIRVGRQSDVYSAINNDLKNYSMLKKSIKWLFSINNTYQNGKKQKLIKIFGIKFLSK